MCMVKKKKNNLLHDFQLEQLKERSKKKPNKEKGDNPNQTNKDLKVPYNILGLNTILTIVFLAFIHSGPCIHKTLILFPTHLAFSYFWSLDF